MSTADDLVELGTLVVSLRERAERWEALARQLGEALDMPFPLSALKRWERTGDAGAGHTCDLYHAMRNAALSVYRDAIEEEG